MELLFMDPVFKEAIWGGTKLRDVFDYEIPSDTTGECWAISGHANGMSHVAGGRFDGKTLGELWKEFIHTQHIIYQRHQIFQGFHYLFSDLLLHLWIICVLISHIYHTDNTIQWCTDIMTHRCQKPCFHFGFPLCCFRSKVKILFTSLGIADTTDRT